ncbi:MAG: N-6 DNA methylase [Muribaculum sp.]|nr:N-6 DNA methylase [Muribaculum sp.]
MAKKQKTFSHVGATDALQQLAERGTTGAEFIYELLRIFVGYGDGQIRRTKEGPGNAAKDGKTILVKGLVAYRNTTGLTDTQMYDTLEEMRSDAKIAKCSPRLYITSDGIDVIAYDPKENDFYENRIDLLWRDFEFFTPLAGIEKIQYAEEAEADVKSAELMAKLFDDIRRYNNVSDPDTVHALNVFMSRLLFCFFAEDTGLFPEQNLFTNTLRSHTKEDGSDVAEFIDRAFLAMSTRDEAVLDTLPDLYNVFPYVNGGLFKERFPIPTLSRRARTLIINCGEYDWKDINPDIFGSMIQAVISPEQRAGLGMHYTSVPNIEKVIRPLFLDLLIKEYTQACEKAKESMAKRMHPDRATQPLRNLLARLANLKFFDPACGSGNFLIITYKRLRELEIMIWQAMRDIANMAVLPMSNVSLTQFYGIELDPFAADTATLSMWLAEHQMNVKFRDAFGVQPDTLPLKPSGQIVCGNACRLDWNTVCPHKTDEEVYIMGNPPYLGSSMQDEEQKADLEAVCGHFGNYKNLDYIASWFYKAAKFIKSNKCAAAFVTTNSICQGDSVNLLWPNIYKQGVEISFAYQSFKWHNNAKYNAGVTVAIIGLSFNKATSSKKLYTDGQMRIVDNINSYLLAGPNVEIGRRSSSVSGLPKMVFGNKPTDGGYLIMTPEEKDALLLSYPSAKRFIKYYQGSDSFINGDVRYCLWITDKDLELAESIPPIHDRFEHVKEFRLQSKAESTVQYSDRPHLFKQRAHKSGVALLVPSVSSERRKYIPMGFVDDNTIASNLTQVVYDASLWVFAALSNRMHSLWLEAVGGKLETRYRYTNLVYDSFPFPKLTTAEKEELSELAQTILDIRDENCDMTLGEMYNPESMPEELREAHHALDLAVERIYRLEPFTSDEERLEHLFRLYAKMTKAK